MSDLRIDTSDKPLPQVTLVGRVDTNTSHELEMVLEPILDAEPAALVLDLSGVEYISSAGLRVVLLATRKMQPRGARLLLCGMSAHVKEVFDIAGFSRLLEIQPTPQAALDALGVGAATDLPTDALLAVYRAQSQAPPAPPGLTGALAQVYHLPSPVAQSQPSPQPKSDSGPDGAVGKPWWRGLIDSVQRQISALRRR